MKLQLNGITLACNATDIRNTKGGVIATSSRLILSLPSAAKRYLISGWQSWSLTAWVATDRPILPMLPSSMHALQTDPGFARERRPNGSWYGAVDLGEGSVVFLGALDLESHVMLDGLALRGSYEMGSGDWFIANSAEDEIMLEYAELLGERLGRKRIETNARTWCSWYSLYTEIHEQQLLKVLGDLGGREKPESMPFDVFQVDDGWQVSIGDWEANSKFPSGMESLATRITETGRKAGLWLAPLLVVPSSRTFQEHKSWLLRNEDGKLVQAGFNWSERLYALDTTHPDVLLWLSELMTKIRKWGYDYIKLDFLYAGALPGKRTVDMPRETAYRNGLKTIRAALGDAYFLTCGAPILPSLGLCDGIRVGPDVAGHFRSHRDDDLLMNFAIPGVRNALRTTLNRLWLQPLVNTDPDVVYFGSRQNTLTIEQKSLLQELAQICGFKASSDIPTWITEPERAALIQFLESNPEVRKLGEASYQIGDHKVDFGAHIGLPTTPGIFAQLEGTVLGWLANIPVLMKTFDTIGKNRLKRMLKQNPV
jgi:alpha-galactosidase